MRKIQKEGFYDSLDTIQVISQASRDNFGEDNFYCAAGNTSAIVCVCDGCGGLGARKYDTFQGHTGAYMASRTVSGAVHDWYHYNQDKYFENTKQMQISLDKYIRKAYAVCESYGVEKIKIKGSMIRKFPTTIAMAYAEYTDDGILIHILWAGDSRVYLLDDKGLAQLTRDDTDVEDALDNLINDGVMTNVLSSDGKYHMNYRSIRLKKPAIIFAATDGCFGYISSPMEFEYEFLNALVHSNTPRQFQSELHRRLSEFAGDDLVLGLMSFFYGDYHNTRLFFKNRLDYLGNAFIDELSRGRNELCVQRLWKKYKPMYERYLTKNNG